jgi:uncharacterized lipoprotein YajG
MRVLLLITVFLLAGCATEPAPAEPVDEINVFATNVERVTESTRAVESILVCGTWSGEQLAKAVVNALRVVPFFANTDEPCAN